MRTTVTLDPDVEARLREVAQEKRISFKEALNSAVRAGLMATRERREYRTPSRSLGLRPGINLDKALQAAADLEDAEIVHELERGR
jgi:hypothetical protein